MICFIFVHSHLYTYHECYLYMVTLTNKFLIRNNGVMILYNDRIVNQIFPMNDYLERLFQIPNGFLGWAGNTYQPVSLKMYASCISSDYNSTKSTFKALVWKF